MQAMIKILANLQDNSSSKAERPPEFKTPSIKEPDFFYGTKPFKIRGLSQSWKLIFQNNKEMFSEYKKKVLNATPFPTGTTAKCIEPYLSNITNKDPDYLLNNRELF
ncbi:hypothetical protein O181_120786 [Austropuccinia psidii MF-1]|uniref:Uncharacterized protein n=1 Tax=Austropuccinia psidii MF-1 TaxID=1389203 RepID=A0A9Q3KIB5_9BASI|nr:hypothetical protein [Austropuccinia psidii MF-1]